MAKFKPSQFDIKTEQDPAAETKILKYDVPLEPVIKPYQFESLKKSAADYQTNKAKYGALASTDTDRMGRKQRDSRFTLNPLLRQPLSVEEEERRVIEDRVQERVKGNRGKVKAKAADFGYQDGLKKGHEEAFQKFRAEAAERLQQFEALFQQCETAKKEIFKANERFLIELVYRIARMVLLKEATTDPAYVTRLAAELIERSGIRENISLKIHPNDAGTISLLKEGLIKQLGELKNLNVEVSEQVTRGGCIVESEWNAIDASLDTQLQTIHQALTGAGPAAEPKS